ncbi:carboxypeptidase-like regulatory domain-containing protein [Altibacter sp.]|uniref:carboxypeptidase-like regulatory domain-containing protein n=1 Tax=Altibacter sp. TaxID=2024823 RepID=UPI0025C5898F|nr:carboxypeptidase-like regulatory domain-containing protein [Altibacter sp.]
MRKKYFLLLLIFVPLCGMAQQDIERVLVKGKITAPIGEDVESVSVYNISSQKGTITNAEGLFELEVAENDRVQVTALQFQSFTVIVDAGVIESERMAIYLNPAVNQLEEVIVRPYDLSGNIIADLNRIKTATINPGWDLSYETLEFEYEFSADESTSVKGNKAEEAYYNGQKQASLDFVGLAGLLFPKKNKNAEQEFANKLILHTALRQRFSNSYVSETFGIPENRVNDFLYFLEERGVKRELLKAENELLLLAFIQRESAMYLKKLDSK